MEGVVAAAYPFAFEWNIPEGVVEGLLYPFAFVWNFPSG